MRLSQSAVAKVNGAEEKALSKQLADDEARAKKAAGESFDAAAWKKEDAQVDLAAKIEEAGDASKSYKNLAVSLRSNHASASQR